MAKIFEFPKKKVESETSDHMKIAYTITDAINSYATVDLDFYNSLDTIEAKEKLVQRSVILCFIMSEIVNECKTKKLSPALEDLARAIDINMEPYEDQE